MGTPMKPITKAMAGNVKANPASWRRRRSVRERARGGLVVITLMVWGSSRSILD
jgi:hypothetical protein